MGFTWILFAGIALGQMGLSIDPTTGHFMKEFGLMLFIYTIGVEVGPTFFASFRSGGIMLNLLAAGLILLGSGLAILLWHITDTDPAAMTGVLYGAVTNTPGLGAAQQTFSDLHANADNPLYAQGYAVAYPLGVIGIIMSITVLKSLCKFNFEEETALMERNRHHNGMELQQSIANRKQPQKEQPNLFFIFIGIVLGILLGMMPIRIPGMSVPV